MIFLIIYNLYILFSGINSNNYYVSINTINYYINISNDSNLLVFNEFNKIFPLSINLTDNDNRGYFNLGSSNIQFSSYTNSPIQKGDIVLLKDNSFALFYNPPKVNINHIYIGNVVSYNISGKNNLNSYWFFDELDNQINEICDNTSVYGEDVYIDFGCNEYGLKCKKRSKFTLFVKGNFRLKKKPSIYLNTIYFTDRCDFQDRNKSLICTIYPEDYPGKLEKEHEFYKMDVKERIDGCEELVDIGMNVYLNNFYILYAKYLILFFLLLF